jgi:hypothetical protein
MPSAAPGSSLPSLAMDNYIPAGREKSQQAWTRDLPFAFKIRFRNAAIYNRQVKPLKSDLPRLAAEFLDSQFLQLPIFN